MARVRPFRGWRPDPAKAAQIASPPYDVLTVDEARALAADNALCFLRVVQPEITFDPALSPSASQLHAQAANNLTRLCQEGHLRQDPEPRLYLYRLRQGDHAQVGLVAGVSLAEYTTGRLRPHEQTRPAKVADRAGHIARVEANTGPVFLTYRARPTVDGLVAELLAAEPEYDFTAEDGVEHALWVIEDRGAIDELARAFLEVEHLYIADGHHRAEAALRVRDDFDFAHEDDARDDVLAVLFPDDQVRILGYHRVVADLNEQTPAAVLGTVAECFDVTEAPEAEPPGPGTISMFLNDRWFHLAVRPDTPGLDDPVEGLDAALLQSQLLAPVLGIGDPRTDPRLTFVGGRVELAELERRCRKGEAAAAFALYPVTVEQLFAVADAGRQMPPKSTWFEPKLRSGLIVRSLRR